MKTIYLLIALCIFSSTHLLGRIKNGYERQLHSSRTSLQQLYSLLEDSDLSFKEKMKVKFEIENMVSYISHYELTEALIRQLKIVSPEIYTDVDNIKDKRGRPTDVYVRIIPKDKSKTQFKAASFFKQMSMDEDASCSDYAEYSVSIDIWVVDNALLLMSHELGHVKYVVPNLATYVKYYKKKYPKERLEDSFIGHSGSDLSGKYANYFAKKFQGDEDIYLQNGGTKLEPPYLLLARFKRNIRNTEAQTPTMASKLAL
jgi:hypothetical protein